jgi:glycosyltransferase involved in cell wall biosynthesis
MHIGFDISQTGAGRAGCGFFAHAMIDAMLGLAPQHRYALYPSFGDFYFDPRMPLASPYRGREVRYGPRPLTRAAAAEFWSADDVEKRLGGPDVVHANNYWCPTTFATSRVVYTCYDLSFAVEPAWTTEANRVGCFEGVFRAAAAADWVVAISQATREHFLEVFPRFPAERVRVIHPASRFGAGEVNVRAPRAAAQLASGEFWLSVGTIEPRKNQERLAEAYARYLALGGKPMPLVLAGGKGWLMEGFRRKLDSLGITSNVVLTGYVTDGELGWLYRNCHANLYPSLFEGFGLPVIEGMQFGAPTIASSSTSLPEAAGGAAVLVAPEDVEGWAQAMLRMSTEPGERERWSAAARERAAAFDAKASAKALLALYEEAVSRPKRKEPRAP